MQAESPGTPYPLVGIGASAGGLEALRRFVGAFREPPGMAFVVVQHLDPHQPSAMIELLEGVGPLAVTAARDGELPRIDTMYVAPPAKRVTMRAGRLRLEPNGHADRHPIDAFMRSLADDAGPRAIAVLLSGSGTDGRAGVSAVREAGGITFAQDESARFPGMPRSAIEAGVVDHVLSPDGLAIELGALGQHPYLRGRAAAAIADAEQPALDSILALLHARRGVDFAGYKEPTLHRRIRRRMALRRLDSIADYARILEAEPVELDALFDDVLINVTAFFRDPDAFDTLRSEILPRIASDLRPDIALRIWVVGCSTGEEAYSIAMSVLEYQADTGTTFPVKLFATDVSEFVLEAARTGVYPTAQVGSLDSGRRSRFFAPSEDGMQVRKHVRDLCVFAKHDVTRDPPFSNIDLISCRNVLIYLGADLQRRVLPTLHYALRPGGVLMLGKAESVGRQEELFTVIDKDQRFYARRPTSRGQLPALPVMAASPMAVVAPIDSRQPRAELLQRHADRVVLSRYGPPGVVVDRDLRVVQFRGDTSRFLENAPGVPTFSVLKMAREPFLPHLSSVLDAVASTGEAVYRQDIRWAYEGREVVTNVLAAPLDAPDASGTLILFEDARSVGPSDTPLRFGLGRIAKDYGRRILQLLDSRTEHGAAKPAAQQDELAATRRRLHRLIDDHETKTEELKAANEEVLSSNEELQSTNEELQTAKEEVQATNEELTTVNDELEARNAMLARANDDLDNLLSSVDIPIVMIGLDRTVRRFTPSAGRLLNLIAGDLGRPLEHINPVLEPPTLASMLEPVLSSFQAQEHEVQDGEGRWYRVTVRPYCTSDSRVDGAVLAIVDINTLKGTQGRLKAARDYAEGIVETVRQPLVVLDKDLRVVSVNRAYARAFGDGEAIGQPLWLPGSPWDPPALRPWLERALAEGNPLKDLEVKAAVRGEPRELILSVRPIESGGEGRLLLALEDVTARRQQDRLETELTTRVLQAQADERERLARELHDETGQALSALLMTLGRLEKRVGDEGVATQVSELRTQVRELIENVGRLARGLHPTALAELGFSGAVRDLVEQFSRSPGPVVTLSIDDEAGLDALPPTVGLALYRVIQEALTNVAKHSGASEATVTLAAGSMGVVATIHDDGRGFDPETPSPTGLGLRLMRRRIGELDGTFRLEAMPGNGTRVKIEIPTSGSEEGHP